MAVEPTSDALAGFDTGEIAPVVMLNLLRFADGGRAAYGEYTRAMASILPRFGGSLVYAGDLGDPLVAGGEEWDAVLLVRYPDRAALLAMIDDPGYREVSRLRADALTAAVLQPTTPW